MPNESRLMSVFRMISNMKSTDSLGFLFLYVSLEAPASRIRKDMHEHEHGVTVGSAETCARPQITKFSYKARVNITFHTDCFFLGLL